MQAFVRIDLWRDQPMSRRRKQLGDYGRRASDRIHARFEESRLRREERRKSIEHFLFTYGALTTTSVGALLISGFAIWHAVVLSASWVLPESNAGNAPTTDANVAKNAPTYLFSRVVPAVESLAADNQINTIDADAFSGVAERVVRGLELLSPPSLSADLRFSAFASGGYAYRVLQESPEDVQDVCPERNDEAAAMSSQRTAGAIPTYLRRSRGQRTQVERIVC